MKNYIKLIILSFSLLSTACKKQTPSFSPLASLNVANAVIGGKNAKLNTNVRDSVVLYRTFLFGINASENTQVKISPSNNLSTSYFNQVGEIANGGIYSLFLTGTPSLPESIFVKDNIPGYSRDSVINIRVINLSPNSGPLNITLGSSQNQYQFSNVTYKTLTDFKTLPWKTLIPTGSNVFEVRDLTGNLLTSYTLPVNVNAIYPNVSIGLSRFRNLTLVVKGMKDVVGSDALGIYPMPNY